MNLFADNKSTVVAVDDASRKILILIQAEGGNASKFPDTYIMNFECADKADYQLNKSLSKGFLFNSFGNSITSIVVTGFQAGGIMVQGRTAAASNNIEEYYRKHSISSDSPTLFKITMGSDGNIVRKPSVYKGYMVGFTRKPMGEEKIQGFGFSLAFMCTAVGDKEG